MTEKLWWQTGIVYQVYPRSFQDSTGDGVGDLTGITSRLAYLQWLGVTAVWISPCFRSPMADHGYDVSDYRDIDPLFGVLADFDNLLAEAHRLGLKVILDFVPNHTSEQHPWFLESKSSRDNPKRDWYIWHDPKPDGSPPNNWLANFGGIAWEWDETTQQYYYHAFLKEQPDLNWRNPAVRQAMFDNLRFWLDRGVDGFRVDVMNSIIKDDQFRDNPPNPGWKPGDHPYLEYIPAFTLDRPEVQDVVTAMRAVFDEYDERVIIGEIYLPIERLVRYYGENGDGAHLPFNFQLVIKPWEAAPVRDSIRRYYAAIPPGGWPNWVLGNHDRPRIASRAGREQARVAAMALLTLWGTPTIYQGDELGMEDVPIPLDKIQDPQGLNIDPSRSRDPERTPMQWDASPNAGFTTAPEPWLPVASDYRDYNVEQEREDPKSFLTLHRRLIDLRQSEPALNAGSLAQLDTDGDLVAYERADGGTRFLVALNLGAGPASLPLDGRRGQITLTTHLDRLGDDVSGALELRGDEGVIVRLS